MCDCTNIMTTMRKRVGRKDVPRGASRYICGGAYNNGPPIRIQQRFASTVLYHYTQSSVLSSAYNVEWEEDGVGGWYARLTHIHTRELASM